MIYVTFPSNSTPQQQYTWEAFYQTTGNYIGTPTKGIVNANIQASGIMMATPFLVAKNISIISAKIYVGLVGDSASVMNVGIYSNVGVNTPYPSTLQGTTGENIATFNLDILNESEASFTSSIDLTPGLYWIVCIHNSSVILPQMHCIASPGTAANTFAGLLGFKNNDQPIIGYSLTLGTSILPNVMDSGGTIANSYLPNIILGLQ